jgi:hypothetical protein
MHFYIVTDGIDALLQVQGFFSSPAHALRAFIACHGKSSAECALVYSDDESHDIYAVSENGSLAPVSRPPNPPYGKDHQMNIVIPRHEVPELRKILAWTAEECGEKPVIEEVLGWIWEEITPEYTAHALRLLMRWHAMNDEHWPASEDELPLEGEP